MSYNWEEVTYKKGTNKKDHVMLLVESVNQVKVALQHMTEYDRTCFMEGPLSSTELPTQTSRVSQNYDCP